MCIEMIKKPLMAKTSFYLISNVFLDDMKKFHIAFFSKLVVQLIFQARFSPDLQKSENVKYQNFIMQRTA